MQRCIGLCGLWQFRQKYLTGIGAPESKVCIGRNTVDTSSLLKNQAIRKAIKSERVKEVPTYLGYPVPRKMYNCFWSVKTVAAQEEILY
ncbi:MAG: hypothetical protein IPI23_07750 [Bacteroidetes bacterium]|nr:hypothetical protein [Bacteroidota bacterium]